MIDAFQAVENVSETPERTFEIDPRALFAALKAERAGGPKLVGYWHSHPSGNPCPSPTDREMAALDDKLWLIVAAGRVALWRPVEVPVVASNDGLRWETVGTRLDFVRVPLATDDVRDLLPLGKSDGDMVPLLAEAGYPAVAPYLDELLSWVYDCNWPIATPMAEWLATLGAPMIDPLRRILRGEDGDAKTNCLWSTARHLDPDVRSQLVDDLRALVEKPTENDRLGQADACAREILAEWGIAD